MITIRRQELAGTQRNCACAQAMLSSRAMMPGTKSFSRCATIFAGGWVRKALDRMRGISPTVREGSEVNEMKHPYIRSFPVFAFALLFAGACHVQQAAKPLKPPQTQTETRALPANSAPQLQLVIDG